MGGLSLRSLRIKGVGILKAVRKQGSPNRTVLANVKSMALLAEVKVPPEVLLIQVSRNIVFCQCTCADFVEVRYRSGSAKLESGSL